jgi:hypothetical protein
VLGWPCALKRRFGRSNSAATTATFLADDEWKRKEEKEWKRVEEAVE